MEEIVSTTDHYQRIYRKTMENYICLFCHWELTYRCNLYCRHCYATGNQNEGEFSLEKAKSILDELKEMSCLDLTFSGGEILMRQDFFEIASYARIQGFALRLLTNATLIDETISRQIASLYPLTVETSIYAAHKNLHDSITKIKGSYDKLMQAIKLLKQQNLKVILKFLVMKNNSAEFPAVKALAESLGVDFLFDFCVVMRNDGGNFPLRYRLNSQEIKDFFIANNSPLNIKSENDEALLCSAGLNNIFITPYLDVYPCVGIRKGMGNLWQDRLKDLWRSAGLNFIRGIDGQDLYKCKSCALKKFCDRCLGIALEENGDLLGPSSFDCSVAEIINEVIVERQKEAGLYGK